jgi:transposase
MGSINRFDRDQIVLFPEVIDDYLDAANPVRFLAVFVDGLDLKALGFTHATPKKTGRPSYHPGDMLKLYLYGYFYRGYREKSGRWVSSCRLYTFQL